jgi:caffeoyl-CoA O-methyltransferase
VKSDGSWIAGRTDVDWIESHAAPPHPVLTTIEAAADPEGVPIVDREVGRVLSVLAAGRSRILEVGTAYGYSTLWMALGQGEAGRIVTIDPDADRTRLARRWWSEAGLAEERIEVITAPALEAFAWREPALDGPFDLAFIDALKGEYGAYLEAIVPRLAPHALVVADNVLWSGRVSGAVAASEDDSATAALRAFDMAVLGDTRFTSTILPVGDGLLIAAARA